MSSTSQLCAESLFTDNSMSQMCVENNSDMKFDRNSKSLVSSDVQPNVGVQVEVK